MAEEYKTREERRKMAAKSSDKNAPKNNSGKKSKKPRNLFKRVILILLTIGIIGLIAGGATFAYYVSGTPELDEKLLKDPVSSKILDSNGEVLAELGTENRDYVNYEDIPKKVENAFLATEDVRFYEHSGIDFRRLGGAVLANFTSGFGSQGASTLTQQVVKRSYLTPDKTIKRKVQEMWLSLQLERKYTKEEIFEMYVNKIFFANRANGILTASRTYYGKELKDLETNEIALLVGLPQSPSRYNPYTHPERAKERRDVVLHLMNKHGFISEEEMKKAQAIPVMQGIIEKDTSQIDTTPYDAYIDQVIEEVQGMGDYNIFTDGLEVHTTIDKDAQEYVYKLLNSNDIIKYPSEKLQAGITLLDTKTGEIKAIGGGRNTKVKRGFNFATDAKRSPGSTIKPIIDYGPAVEYLNWSTYQPIKDEPYSYSNGTPLKNASGSHYGTVTAREALARSLNIPALKALQEVGLDRAREFAVGLGIPFPQDMVESAAIGGGKDISTLELAGAMSSFGNEGIYNKPHTVSKIVLRDKTTIKNKVESKAVMKDSTAFIVTDMLKSVLNEDYGTGRLGKVPGLPAAAKTGSTNFTPEQRAQNNIPSNGVKDSWMTGYTTNYTVAIWAGYENKAGEKMEYLGDSSQRIPKYLFKNIMQHMATGKETKDFTKPDSVVKVDIVKGSNPAVKANQYTPKDRISSEYFVKGHEPTQVTKEFTKLKGPSGFSVTYDEEKQEIHGSWNYSDEGSPDFETKVSIEGGGEQVLSVSGDTSFSIKDPQPGKKYSFSVTAILDGQRSDPAKQSVTIPEQTEEEAEEPDENEEEMEEPDENEQEAEEPDENENENENPAGDNSNQDDQNNGLPAPDNGSPDENNGNNGNNNGNINNGNNNSRNENNGNNNNRGNGNDTGSNPGDTQQEGGQDSDPNDDSN
ncbi:transglycosylase domain-containing protein [Bacillus massiliglaciei]|uniref:transglycosylase domain-containing protein n=1 Tax=Bacillus massiliglaciei TaxID=1816693 RepID=UPI000A5EDA1D|nr:penicillin-binding protein 1A [Bacillus massiliglaciei]